jgi:hypothetical protein
MYYSKVVEVHKRQIKTLIRASDVTAVVRLPVVQTPTGNPLFGELSREGNTGGLEKGPYRCLWYDALTAKSMGKQDSKGVETIVENSPGQFREATAFAEFWLEDVLIDGSDAGGQTWFDKAMHVVVGNQRYKFLGYAKLGLSVGAPYLLMVGLKGGLGYDES